MPDTGGSLPSRTDAGFADVGPVSDARPDAGALADSGIDPLDAGRPADAGFLAPDAESPRPDADVAMPDAGALTPDAGFLVPDVGIGVADSGVVPPDAGLIVPDAGPRNRDAGPPADGGVSSIPPDIQALLAITNQARADTGSGPMTWNADLAQTALSWAQQCMWQHAPRNQRQYQGQTLGENLAASTALTATAESLGQLWIDEIAYYDCPANTCAPNEVCGHYTQIIWRSSVEVGCAVINCNTGSPFGVPSWRYLVCRYLPAGNIVGRRPIPASDCP